MEEEANLEWMPDHVAEKIRSVKEAEIGCRLRYKYEKWSSERIPHHPKHIRLAFDRYEFYAAYRSILREARIFRNEITYLEIKFYAGIQERSMINRWVNCFINLLDRLKHSPLQYLEINNLWFLLYRVGNPDARIIYNRIYRAIIPFLESQRQLLQVKIVDCLFTYQDILEIVRRLENNENISQIWLECDSFASFRAAEVSQREEILPLLNRLQNFPVLLIDYSYVLGDHADPANVLGLLKSRNLSFLRIFLRVSSFTSNFKRFESSQWTNLKEEQPDLEIQICIITDAEHREQNELFIVNYMPVTYVYYTLLKDSCVNELDRFVAHLVSCGVNEHLHYLGFKLLSPDIPNLNSILSTFVSRCSKVEMLFITMVYPQNRLDDLVESLANHCPRSLTDIWFNIIGVGSEENKRMLEDSTAVYYDRLDTEDRCFDIELKI